MSKKKTLMSGIGKKVSYNISIINRNIIFYIIFNHSFDRGFHDNIILRDRLSYKKGLS